MTQQLTSQKLEELNFYQRWAHYQFCRNRIQQLVGEIDLAGTNLSFSLQTEGELRKRVDELLLLANRLKDLLGLPEPLPANIS